MMRIPKTTGIHPRIVYDPSMEGWRHAWVDPETGEKREDIWPTEEAAVAAVVELHGVDPKQVSVWRRGKGEGSVSWNTTKNMWELRWFEGGKRKGKYLSAHLSIEQANQRMDEITAARRNGEKHESAIAEEKTDTEYTTPSSIIDAEMAVFPVQPSLTELRSSRRILHNRVMDLRRNIIRLQRELVNVEDELLRVDNQIGDLVDEHLGDGLKVRVQIP